MISKNMVLNQNNTTSCRKPEDCQNLPLFIWLLFATELFLMLWLFRAFFSFLKFGFLQTDNSMKYLHISQPCIGSCLYRLWNWCEWGHEQIYLFFFLEQLKLHCLRMGCWQLHFSWFIWGLLGGFRVNWVAVHWPGRNTIVFQALFCVL